MRLPRRKRLAGVAMLAVVSLMTLAACGGGDSGDAGAKFILADGNEPQNPLVPTATNEVGGGNIIDLIFAGLVSYEVDGTPQNELAESIESEDNQLWTIKLKKGWEFTNGTEVKAHNFVDAWNYGAYGPNAQFGSYFFTPIKGYDEVSKEDATVKEMSGLKIIDDYTFTVELKQPESDFPLRLGYSAYVPLPDVAFEDMEAFGEDPIGNGPYKLDGKDAWKHDQSITLVPNEKYEGNREPKNEGIKFIFYTSLDAAYTDLLDGNLDVLKQVPTSAFSTYQDNENIQSFSQPGSVFQSFTIPNRLDHFGDNEEGHLRRAAISMAINRAEICEKIYFGQRTPATDFGSPVLPAYSDSLEGSAVLKYNPEEAKKLWEKADAINPWTGTFTIAYNADGDHKAWVDAVTNSIKNVLEIKAKGESYTTFKDFRNVITERTIDTAFRTGWQADYPSLYNYLASLYASGAADGNGSNDGDYKSEKFDKFLKAAAGADSEEERVANLHKAEEVLLKDLPAIPLWYSNVTGAASLDVENVKFNWKNVPEYELITFK